MKKTSKKFSEISKSTIDRYSKRLDVYGNDIKTLGWGNESQQSYRFRHTLDAADFTQKSILDIGCGFGDYYKFLKSAKIAVSAYTGWDINQKLIDEIHLEERKNKTFEVVDLAKDVSKYRSQFDIAVMIGLLNVNLGDEDLNYEYSERLITNAFSAVKEVLIVDFLSIHVTDTYPKEDFVFYHDFSRMFEFALTLSNNVVLKHNYDPIPQKEFMLYIYK